MAIAGDKHQRVVWTEQVILFYILVIQHCANNFQYNTILLLFDQLKFYLKFRQRGHGLYQLLSNAHSVQDTIQIALLKFIRIRKRNNAIADQGLRESDSDALELLENMRRVIPQVGHKALVEHDRVEKRGEAALEFDLYACIHVVKRLVVAQIFEKTFTNKAYDIQFCYTCNPKLALRTTWNPLAGLMNTKQILVEWKVIHAHAAKLSLNQTRLKVIMAWKKRSQIVE